MNYIVLELFPEPYIVQNFEGKVWITTDLELAKELAEDCQQGMVVPLTQSLMDDIEEGALYCDSFDNYFNDEQNTTT